MIKAVAFDLWETLITERPEVPGRWRRLRLERIDRILAERGLTATAERLEFAYHHTWQRCQELYWSSDKDISCRQQIDHFVKALELDVDEPTLAAIEEAYATASVELLPSIVPGADAVTRQLKDRGFRLGLISNTGRTPGYALREILKRLDLAAPFDAMVFSNEHRECKPQRSIFEALRRALDVDFNEMLFIGDNVYVDVHGAQRCGMIGIHFVPPSRGTAVAPIPDHDLTIEPDATIRDLCELPRAIDALSASPRARLSSI